MNHLAFGGFSIICSIILWVYFGTYPPSAAAFPKIIITACFILPGIVSLILGVRQKEYARLSGGAFSSWIKDMSNTAKSKTFLKLALLIALTLIYVYGTSVIGYFPMSVIYFLVVLFAVYKAPIKETLLYTAGSVGFLYVFFKLIFHVRI